MLKPKKRFHCQICNELIVRRNDEKDELASYKRHCKGKHPHLPEPHSLIFSSEDLNENEKECLSELQDTLKQLKEIGEEQKIK